MEESRNSKEWNRIGKGLGMDWRKWGFMRGRCIGDLRKRDMFELDLKEIFILQRFGCE